MRVFDLSCFEDQSPIETDICIVGTGPAGVSIASEFANSGVRVLLLESGGFEDEDNTQALYRSRAARPPPPPPPLPRTAVAAADAPPGV